MLCAAVAWPCAARAQGPARVRRIAWLGLGRAAPGGHVVTRPTRFTYDGLSAIYDPTLVKLLVPGLDTTGEVAR